MEKQNQIRTLTNSYSHSIRTILSDDNDPLFCLVNVCKALSLQRSNLSRFNLNSTGTVKACIPL